MRLTSLRGAGAPSILRDLFTPGLWVGPSSANSRHRWKPLGTGPLGHLLRLGVGWGGSMWKTPAFFSVTEGHDRPRSRRLLWCTHSSPRGPSYTGMHTYPSGTRKMSTQKYGPLSGLLGPSTGVSPRSGSAPMPPAPGDGPAGGGGPSRMVRVLTQGPLLGHVTAETRLTRAASRVGGASTLSQQAPKYRFLLSRCPPPPPHTGRSRGGSRAGRDPP